MFRLRIDIINDLNIDDLIEICQTTSHVLVRHELPHGNPHYHAFLETELKENALRQRIKRFSDSLKPTDYSLKKCNPDRIEEYVQYMFNTKKGNKWELIDTHNFDDQIITRLQLQAKDVANDFENSKVRKTDKPTIYQLAMEIRESFKQSYNITDNPLNNLGKSQAPEGYDEYYEHLKIAIQVCRKHHQPFEEHYLRRLVTTAICEGSTGRATIIAKIMAREFPDH